MELKSVRTVRSPLAPDRVRVIGQIGYDDRPGQFEECWFDFPQEYADSLSTSGSPWLACMLPLATTLGEPLRIGLPVDRLLYRNVYEVLAIWKAWYPQLRLIDVVAGREAESPSGRRTGAFFSGGLDAFFTLLHNESPDPDALRVDELICVGGLDIPLRNLDAFFRHRTRMERVAHGLGKRVIDVVTNLRETRLEAAGWYDLLHGPGLIAIGLMLGARYEKLLIASGQDYDFEERCGSHPLTDPLFSTSRTRVIYDGARFSRWEKTEFLAGSAVAMENLHVCWARGGDENCGACEKCARTMLGLELVGGLQNCKTLPYAPLDSWMSRLFLSRPAQEHFYEAGRDLAFARGREDVAKAIDRCLRRSRVLRPLVELVAWLRGKRFFWRFAGPLKRMLLARAIR